MDALNTALDFIKGWEGCRLKAYQDVVGVWTIGFGQTGPAIGPGLVWTQNQADAALEHYLVALMDVLDGLLERDTSDNQFAALTSLAYNIGTSAFAKSTVLRKLNIGDYPGAGDAFLMWKNAGGKVVQGLLNRRHAERALFLKDG